ncbi:hypothetical protein ACLBV9_11580 [Staphylococcus succinus]|uniref:hypothetical protein n=1 Tax=Staphylococcus succinus TaxID=61015 RepID=UPI0013049D41|nr:hypothetical protein [Staphylococcus succinus]MEB8128097.1 hypothetical protein [Staphylococcus succinus]MEB8211369.1 hypothetical protein [Staphylococcus succinus]
MKRRQHQRYFIPSNDTIEQQYVYDALCEWDKTYMSIEKIFNAMHSQVKTGLK